MSCLSPLPSTCCPPTCHPTVAAAGFPIRVVPLTMPGYVTRPALGMQGDDIEECVHGPAVNCTFDSALEAFAACGVLKECRSVVVYENGE